MKESFFCFASFGHFWRVDYYIPSGRNDTPWKRG